MVKHVVRAVSVVIILVCTFVGAYMMSFYNGDTSKAGVEFLRLLYEYNSFSEIEERQGWIKSLCTPEVYEELSVDNDSHWQGTYRRTSPLPTKVRVVLTRPGLIIYALDNAYIYPTELWCFEYEITKGLFSEVREYKLANLRTDEKGGLIRVSDNT